MKCKDQTLFLVSKVEEFEKYFKNKKLTAKSEKIGKKNEDQSTKKKSLKNDST